MGNGERCIDCGSIKESLKDHDCPVKRNDCSDGKCGSMLCRKCVEEGAKDGLCPIDIKPFPLRPLEDLVFVKRTAKDTVSYGGVILAPNNSDNPKTSGEIMAVGPGKFSETLGRVIRPQISVGAKVVFSRHANMSIDIEGIIPKDGEEYLVMHADELIAVITGEGGASLAKEPAPKVRAVN